MSEKLTDSQYIARTFTYHPPTGDQPAAYEMIRDTAKEMAVVILNTCPDSRERSLALTNLEQAVMWANAAVARRYK